MVSNDSRQRLCFTPPLGNGCRRETMPRDDISILSRGATNSKRVEHESKRSTLNPPSQGDGAAGVQRLAFNVRGRNPNLLGVTELLPVIPCAKWKLPIGRH